jgi:hypothetical protein
MFAEKLECHSVIEIFKIFNLGGGPGRVGIQDTIFVYVAPMSRRIQYRTLAIVDRSPLWKN